MVRACVCVYIFIFCLWLTRFNHISPLGSSLFYVSYLTTRKLSLPWMIQVHAPISDLDGRSAKRFGPWTRSNQSVGLTLVTSSCLRGRFPKALFFWALGVGPSMFWSPTRSAVPTNVCRPTTGVHVEGPRTPHPTSPRDLADRLRSWSPVPTSPAFHTSLAPAPLISCLPLAVPPAECTIRPNPRHIHGRILLKISCHEFCKTKSKNGTDECYSGLILNRCLNQDHRRRLSMKAS